MSITKGLPIENLFDRYNFLGNNIHKWGGWICLRLKIVTGSYLKLCWKILHYSVLQRDWNNIPEQGQHLLQVREYLQAVPVCAPHVSGIGGGGASGIGRLCSHPG